MLVLEAAWPFCCRSVDGFDDVVIFFDPSELPLPHLLTPVLDESFPRVEHVFLSSLPSACCIPLFLSNPEGMFLPSLRAPCFSSFDINICEASTFMASSFPRLSIDLVRSMSPTSSIIIMTSSRELLFLGSAVSDEACPFIFTYDIQTLDSRQLAWSHLERTALLWIANRGSHRRFEWEKLFQCLEWCALLRSARISNEFEKSPVTTLLLVRFS